MRERILMGIKRSWVQDASEEIFNRDSDEDRVNDDQNQNVIFLHLSLVKAVLKLSDPPVRLIY